MDKHTFKPIAIAMILATTAISAKAQTTPQAIIGQCPDLPSVANLAASSDNEAANAAIDAFQGQLNRLRDKVREANKRESDVASAAARQDAERITKEKTGKSVNEIQNMSAAQQEALGRQLAGQQLSSMGLGNMSMADLEALEGKSDEEIIATFSKVKPTVSPNGAIPAEVNTGELRKIQEQWSEIDLLNNKEIQEVAQKIAEIQERYRPQIEAIPHSNLLGNAYNKSEEAAYNKLASARDSECYTLWRNQVGKIQGRIKTKLADAPRYDELTAQSFASGGLTSTAKVDMQGAAWSIANEYLNATASITNLP
jgi:hypothetical protein